MIHCLDDGIRASSRLLVKVARRMEIRPASSSSRNEVSAFGSLVLHFRLVRLANKELQFRRTVPGHKP